MGKKSTKAEFIEKARKIHGDKYDYSKAEYVNSHTKICIICPEHGEFWQTPNGHLNGFGCPKCGVIKVSLKETKTTEQFIIDAKKIHGDRFDYSKVKYINKKTKVCIICPEHGEFWQTPDSHLSGNGCRKCSNEKLSKERMISTEKWIEKAKSVHGDRYSYEKTIYKGNDKKLTITCPIHGDFQQLAYDHIQGKGCRKCRKSKMEIEISSFLTEQNIQYTEQYRPKFLNIGKSRMSLDFFLPEYNAAIECQGAQHFIGNTFYSRVIEEIIERDRKKQELCKENGIKVFYYTNLNKFHNEKENLYICKEKLLDVIKNEGVL